MGVKDETKIEWMAEYAEYHSINENAYANVSNIAGLGGITAPNPSTLPGTTIGTNYTSNSGTLGSGDLGQNNGWLNHSTIRQTPVVPMTHPKTANW
jgi:hypothetical protein